MQITPKYYIIACIVFIFICILLAKPLKRFFRVVVNSFLGLLVLTAFNFVGGLFGLYIGVNAFTAVTVGLLGIPGFIFLFVLKFLL